MSQDHIDPFIAEGDPAKCAVDLLLAAADKPDTKPVKIRRRVEDVAFLAARKNKPLSVQKMVERMPALLKRSYRHDNTLLFTAASYGSQRSVEYLLSKGADPFEIGKNNQTARQRVKEKASQSGANNYSVLVKILLNKELEVLQNKIESGDLEGVKNVLTRNPDLCNQKLPNGFMVSEFQKRGSLLQMIKSGDRAGVEKILASNPNLLNEELLNGLTPLALAIDKSWVIADFLLSQDHIDPFIAEGDSAKCAVDLLLAAAGKPDTKPVEIQRRVEHVASLAAANNKPASLQKIISSMPQLLEYRDDCNDTLLVTAAYYNSIGAVKYLLSQGADPFALGQHNQTARQWAIQKSAQSTGSNYQAVQQLLLKKELEGSRKMVGAGDRAGVEEALASSPDWRGQKIFNGLTLSEFWNRSVLQRMIGSGDRAGVEKALTNHPELLNALLPNGLTPLAWAIDQSWMVTDFLLSQKNIDPFIAESDPAKCAVDLLLTAVDKPDTKPVEIQRRVGHVASLAAANNKLASLQKMIKKVPMLLKHRDHYNNTLLIIAACYGSQKVVEYLLSQDADPLAIGDHGTACEWAGHSAISSILKQAEQMAPLVRAIQDGRLEEVNNFITTHSGSLNKRFYNGYSPLGFAIVSESFEVADLLIRKGADLFVPVHANSKQTALDVLAGIMKEYARNDSTRGILKSALAKRALQLVKDRFDAIFFNKSRYLEDLKKILSAMPYLINYRYENGETLLMRASRQGDKELISYLVKVDASSKNVSEVLHQEERRPIKLPAEDGIGEAKSLLSTVFNDPSRVAFFSSPPLPNSSNAGLNGVSTVSTNSSSSSTTTTTTTTTTAQTANESSSLSSSVGL